MVVSTHSNEGPKDLERGVITAEYGEDNDAAQAESPWPHNKCLDRKTNDGENKELVAGSLNKADNFAFQILSGERLPISFLH